MFASIEFAAHLHAQIEEWNDRDDVVPRERGTNASLCRKMEATQDMTGICVDMDPRYKCMGCGKKKQVPDNSRNFPRPRMARNGCFEGETVKRHMH